MSIGIKLVAMAVVFAAAAVAATFMASCALLTSIHRVLEELFTNWCLVIGEILLSSLPVTRKKCHSTRRAKAANLVCSDEHIL
jgi:hypothetical protein